MTLLLLLVQLAAILFGSYSATLNCPEAQKITPCICSPETEEVSCFGPDITQKTLDDLMSSLKASNPTGADIKIIKVSDTNIQQVNIQIFTGNISYNVFDFSSNQNLQYIYRNTDYTKPHIKAKYVSFSTCKLIWNDTSITDALNLFADPDVLDLSNNRIDDIPVMSGIYFDENTLKYTSNVVFNLSNNYITDIGYHWFNTIPNAKLIDLSHNRIKNIWNEAFAQKSPSVEYIDEYITIDLSDNRLSETSKFYNTIFDYLKRPSKLILESNVFSYLPQGVFQAFLQSDPKNLIFMGKNILICNSYSQWLQDYKIVYKDRVLDYICANAGGKSIFDL